MRAEIKYVFTFRIEIEFFVRDLHFKTGCKSICISKNDGTHWHEHELHSRAKFEFMSHPERGSVPVLIVIAGFQVKRLVARIKGWVKKIFFSGNDEHFCPG